MYARASNQSRAEPGGLTLPHPVPIRYHVITQGGEVIARHQVVLFLHLMKETARLRFHFVRRPVNLGTLALLGLMPRDAEDRVPALVPEDYVSGPDRDRSYPGNEVWVFGPFVNGTEVYVKIQVIANPPERCVCISFHKADRPMRYPLRQTEPPAKEEDRR
jgi:hypothetical protein